MLIRVVALAAGLAVAGGLSQFPEYSQQYTQRLAGAVGALSDVVEAFDADARRLEMTRAEALQELSESGRMGEARAQSMRIVFARHDRLSQDLAALKNASPVARVARAWRMNDAEIARQAWQDFRLAVPLSSQSLVLALLGFLGGWALTGMLCTAAGAVLGRRKAV